MSMDDLVHTLSDGDISDEEASEIESAQPKPNGIKRKRSKHDGEVAVKKQKQGQSDEDIESDFEFDTGDNNLEELDVWALNGDVQEDQPGSIEAIVARRRTKPQQPAPDAASEDDDSEIDVESDDGSDLDGEVEGAESDEEEAAPVPHPDDAGSESEVDVDEEDDDAAEEEKRNAFFAKDEPSGLVTDTSGFHNMNLSRPIMKGLASIGFSKPTPIQAKTIPVALEGKDLVGGAVTGSGKTAAFLIPILERLLFRPKRTATTRVAILMPTRELALQCFAVAKKLANFTDITFGQAIGGLNSREQEKQLKLRPDIVIATPGRFIDIERNSFSFAVNTIEILVLDEADRMLEEGFADELNEILNKIPKSRQTMLFSATMTSKVDDLIRVGLQRPLRVMVDAQRQTVSGLVQEFVRLRPGREGKRLAYLLHLCERVHTERVIIFFRQKKDAHRIRVIFALCGLKAAELHGSMSQEQRINAIESFRTGKASFLLATDLASRGLDIKGIDTVINFEAPQTHEIYLHRVGRTARAGRTGRSCTLAAEPDRKVVKAAVKSAKAQGAQIRQRTIDPADADAWQTRLDALEEEVEEVLREEKEERALQQVDRDLNRADNIVKFEDEIKARPKKTWFATEKDKQAAREKGSVLLNGVPEGEGWKKEKKGKLSNKERKKLRDRDDRRAGKEWKKGKADRMGSISSKSKTKTKSKSKKSARR